jgi:tetratricopeptide (TPR) repeat protein
MSTTSLSQLLKQAVAIHRQGDLVQAETLYLQLLKELPDEVELLLLLGILLLQSNRPKDADKYLMRVFVSRGPDAELCNNLGIANRSLGRIPEAIKFFNEAIQINPAYLQGRYNLALLLYENKDLAKAASHCAVALKQDPTLTQWNGLFGQILHASGELNLAEKYLKCSDLKNPTLLLLLAKVLAEQEHNLEAIEYYQRYLQLYPKSAEVLVNLSYVAERAGQFDQAVQAAKMALKLEPELVEAWNNLGIAYRGQHHLGAAIDAFESGIRCRSDFPLAKFNLATTWMLDEKYEQGWDGYELRTALVESPGEVLKSSVWNGSRAPGKRLLITVDQGLGDAIQYARFLPRIQHDSGCHLIVCCQPGLMTLMKASFPGIEFVDENQTTPAHDLHFSLMSVGKLWQLSVNDVGMSQVYLKCGAEAQARMAEQLQSNLDALKPRIGINWRGNPKQSRDIVRSMKWQDLEPLFLLPDLQWVSLNIDPLTQAEIKEHPEVKNVIDASPWIRSIEHTAALMTQLDLIVTVDTSIAHLAGAMNRPVWTLLCHTPDWRWHLNRVDSPWYPAMKLFRQPAFADWKSVIKEVQTELSRTDLFRQHATGTATSDA